MNSNNEEYLDSLLNSAQKSNSNNPQSALSRMSSMRNSSGSPSGSGDIGALVNNSNGNKDLNEIGSLLSKLDADEIVDDRMADLLDDIENRATLPFLNLRQQDSVFLDYLPKTDVLWTLYYFFTCS